MNLIKKGEGQVCVLLNRQNRAFEAGFHSGSEDRMAHRKGAKSSAWGRILRVHGGLAKLIA